MNNSLAISISENFKTPFGSSGGFGVGDLIGLIINGAIGIAGLAMIGLLIFAGISFIAGAGNNDPDQTAKGKKAATAAIIGFVIIIGAYLIARIIEIIFVGPTGPQFLTKPNV